ncbi:MAG TPA: MlaD family protein [Ignavibacteriaceae bacterium]|nr:MlaD family protein [Ignavibacteriaceae bacterium]
MKDQRKTEIKVGITVIIGIIIFIWIIGWAKNFSLSSNENIIDVRFKNVSGLEIGDAVTVNGVRKGYVDDMVVNSESVNIKLRIDNSIQLKSDASFSISMLDLMGGKKVDIIPGTSMEPFNYDVQHEGTFNSDIPALMTLVGSYQEELTNIITATGTALTSLNQYLTDPQINSDLKNSLSNLNSLLVDVKKTLNENDQNISKLIQNSVELTEEAKSFISQNRDGINSSLTDLKTLLAKSDSLVSKFNRLTDETTTQQNNLGKILYDEELVKSIKNSLTQLEELTKIILHQVQNEGINIDAHIF